MYRIISAIAAFCMSCTLVGPASAQISYDTDPAYQAARTAMIEGRDAEAFPVVKRTAEAGFHKAQYNLAMMYKSGRGTAASHADYLKWMEASAAQDFPLALFTLGVDYAFGRGTAVDMPRALKYYNRAAELGHAEAQYYLAQMHREGNGTPASPVLYRKWMDASAAQNFGKALFRLGSDYDFGTGVTKDLPRALGYYERGAAAGDTMAAYNAGQLHLMGETGIPVDKEKAMIYIEQAGRSNNGAALMTLGYIYEVGMTGLQDIDRSRDYYYRAEAAGMPAAAEAIDRLKRVASDIAYTKMLSNDHVGAMAALKKLCDEADMEACAYYGNYLANGAPGIQADLKASLAPLKASCDAGDVYGCKVQAYAVIKAKFSADELSRYKAASWFSNRCGYDLNEDAEACYNLAVMYYNGTVKGGKDKAREVASGACKTGYQNACRMVRAIDDQNAYAARKAEENARKTAEFEAEQAARSARGNYYSPPSSFCSSSGSYASSSSISRTQDNADFNAFINKVNSYGTGYSASCRTGNPYC